jgi:hypothetical protein
MGIGNRGKRRGARAWAATAPGDRLAAELRGAGRQKAFFSVLGAAADVHERAVRP